MGRNKRNEDVERKFVPRISSASRKLAARRFEQASLEAGVPHFMREIKCQSRIPLAPIPAVNNYTNSSSEEEKNSNGVATFDKEVLKPIAMNTKQAPAMLDDNVFTFKPKVSSASAKIVENLGTDFMARQQQHLEKQKKLVSFNIINVFCRSLRIVMTIFMRNVVHLV